MKCGSLCRLAAMLLATFAAVLQGQNLTGTISGSVSDPTGATIPNAKVTITNAATNATVFTGTTSSSGSYLAPSLPVGTYNVSVEAAGFKKVDVNGLILQVGQSARADAQLTVGAASDTITVDGGTFARLERDTSGQDEVINTRQVQNLPLPSRNVLNLLPLVAGVSSGGTSTTGINARQISINGSRTLNTEIAVDGVSVLNAVIGDVTRLPSTEALRELQVLTSGYSAEFGRTSGGYINAVVASGTNEYHGGLYEYFRNEKLNANNFFRNLRGEARPTDRYNQYGFRFGGPVPVLHFGGGSPFRKSSSTFFFVNYEGLKRAVPRSTVSTVPDERYRSGDFSQVLAGPDGVPGTADDGFLRDPLSSAPCGIVSGAPVRTGCFEGNRIPQNRIDPAAAKILGLLPLPNLAGNFDPVGNRRTDNYLSAVVTPYDSHDVTTRIDHNAFNGNTRIFGRLTYYTVDDFTTGAVQIPGPLDPGATTEAPTFTNGWQMALGLTQTITPTLLLDANFGFMRADARRTPTSFGIDVPSVLGIQRASAAVTPRISISNFTPLGVSGNATSREVTNVFQPSTALSYVRGNNVMKVGFQMRKNQFNVFNAGGNYAGVYNITGNATAPTTGGGSPAATAFADFLLGQIANSNYTIPQPLTGRRNYNLGVFFQNDWKVSPRLTVNLGLRYEYETPVSVVNNIYARIEPQTGRLLVAGANASPTLNLKTDYMNFAPRAGFAYSLGDRTVVRAAFGIFHSQIFSNLGGVANSPAFNPTTTFQGLAAGVSQPFTLSQGMPLIGVQNLNDPFQVERTASTSNPLGTGAQFGSVSPLPYTMQWNFGVQRQLPGDIVLDTAYVASRSLHQPLNLPQNLPAFSRADELALAASGQATQLARPFPAVSGFSSFFHEGSATYHSLQLKGSRQFTRAFSFLTSYTWSKAVDDGSGIFGSSQPNGLDAGQFPSLFRNLERAPSAFDRRHMFSLAAQYNTPRLESLPRALRVLVNDFQVNPILIARTGLPDTITQNNTNPLATQQRPNVVNPNSIYLDERRSEGQGIRYLLAANSPSFPYAPSGPIAAGTGANRRLVIPTSIGTLGRNTLREPGEFNVDLSVSRRFRFTERYSLQLRAEAFNVLNHTNFNAPNSGLNAVTDAAGNVSFNSPNFGLITGAKSARFMQMVLRFDF